MKLKLGKAEMSSKKHSHSKVPKAQPTWSLHLQRLTLHWQALLADGEVMSSHGGKQWLRMPYARSMHDICSKRLMFMGACRCGVHESNTAWYGECIQPVWQQDSALKVCQLNPFAESVDHVLQKPQKVRQLLSVHGEVGRLYLAPEGKHWPGPLAGSPTGTR